MQSTVNDQQFYFFLCRSVMSITNYQINVYFNVKYEKCNKCNKYSDL